MSKINDYDRLPISEVYSLLPYQEKQVKEILNDLFKDRIGEIKKIVDATCHIGADSLCFSEIFPNSKILAIDNDPEALKCFSNNIEKFSDPKRFEIIEMDSSTYISKNNPVADIYYFDPPWCDKYYCTKKIDIYLGECEISRTIKYIFLARLSKCVILKSPRNFDIDKLKLSLGSKVDISINDINKEYYKRGNKIAYKLLILTIK